MEPGMNPDNLDAILSGAGGTNGGAGGTTGGNTAGGAGAPSGSPNLDQEFDFGNGTKLKLRDLYAAHGRQNQVNQLRERYQKYEPVIAEFENPEYGTQVQQELINRVIDLKAIKAAHQPPVDLETLKRTSPVDWAERRINEVEKRYQALEDERASEWVRQQKVSVTSAHKLNADQVAQVCAIAAKYPDRRGDPMPLEEAFHIWNAPNAAEERKQLQEFANRRSSGIPGGRGNAALSKKDPSEMTSQERQADMARLWEEAQSATPPV